MYHTEDNICEQMLKYSSTHEVLNLQTRAWHCIRYATNTTWVTG